MYKLNEEFNRREPGSTACFDAVTGEVYGYSVLHSVDELNDAVGRARCAQIEWAKVPVAERVEYILRIRDYLVTNLDELAVVIARDVGKTRIDAMSAEVLPAVLAAGYYCRKAGSFLKPKWVMPGSLAFSNKWNRVYQVPFGVIGIISPWNYPFSIPFSEVIMALLAGNAVVLKTATETQGVGLALKKCIEAADLPEGIFSYINMPGRIAGDAFLEAGIDKLFFTGSVPVGKKLMARAAETLTPVSLELGGNDAMIVCSDADLYRAANGAIWAGLQNAGQSCGGVERIYVDSKVYDPFMKILKTKVENLRVGYDTDHSVDIGAMTTSRQLEVVKHHVEDALEKGAVIHARAKTPGGKHSERFYPPTVLSNVNHEMLVMKEETFGPVLGVMPVDSMDEAITFANDSNLGLTGSVWSRNLHNASLIARRIAAGAVTINDHLMSHGMAETPWGGMKESGIGRTHGGLGFAEMTTPQVVVRDILPLKKNLWWQPYSPGVYNTVKGVALAFYGTSLPAKARGLIDVIAGIPRVFER